MVLEFDAEIWKTGNSHVVTVPKAFIRSRLLDLQEKYEIVIRRKGGLDIESGLYKYRFQSPFLSSFSPISEDCEKAVIGT